MTRFKVIVALLLLSAPAVFQACTTREVVGVVIGGMGIQPPQATVYVGDSVQLTAVVQDDRGEVLSGAQPEWRSSAATVAAVNDRGVVRGLRAGRADVSAEFGGQSVAALITVTLPPVYDFTVTETSGSSVVSEAGGEDHISVALLTQPAEDVVLEVTTDDPGEVTAAPASLVFTPDDWSVPQMVTLTGEDDDLIDGDQTSNVTVAVNASASDVFFRSAAPKVIDVLTRDDEVPGFALTATGGSTSAVEGGASDTVFVVLRAEPASAVRLAVAVDNTLDASVAPDTLTFSKSNWSVPQPVVFAAVDDAFTDGTRSRTITVSVVPGSDPAFVGLPPRTLPATTVDNEVAAWTVSHTNGTTSAAEGGATDSIAVTIQSNPASVVVFDVSLASTGDATVSPKSLIFTSGGAMTQWVVFSAVDDPDLDGTRSHTVTVSVNPASDPPFIGLPSRTLETTTTDNDVAGFTVSETGGGTEVTEGGGTDSFTIVLQARPASNVTFQVTSADLTEVAVAPASLSFTPSTWNSPQSVTVTGVDDTIGDGDQSTEITIAVAAGSNAAFLGLPNRTVTATTRDNEGIGFTVSETDGTVVNETGTLSDAIAVRLNSVPTDQVVLDVTSADLGEVTAQPTRLTFTPANGGDAQAVVVSGVDDLIEDGDVVTQLTVSVNVALTLDAAYDTVSARTVSVTTLDNEVPNIILAETGGSTSVQESGTTDAFTVILSAQPLSNVVLDVVSNDPGEVVADSAKLTFTPANWSVPKTVVVRGVDDGIADGDQVTAVVVSVDAAASDDAWDAVAPRQVLVTNQEVAATFTVSESGGSTSVHESGTSDVLTVSLQGSPTSNVVLTVTSGDTGEAVVDSTTLTFTPSNWSTPRTVTVTGVADGFVDGPQLTVVTIAVAAGSDSRYVGLAPRTVNVTTDDAQVPSFTVSETGGATVVDEVGGTDAVLVVLGAQPQSQVVIGVSSGDVGEVTADSATLTFTPSNWSTPKTVTLSGVDDATPDGNQLTLVTFGVVDASSDDLWDGLADQSVVVTTVDVTADFIVAETGGGTSVDESGTSDAFTVVLSEQPSTNVVMTVTVADPGEVAADSSTLTFTSVNWATPKTVTLTGVNDPTVDGAQVSSVTISVVAGSDPSFVGLAPKQISVTTTDDDVASFEITESGGSTAVDESGTTDAFTVVLGAQPLTNVVLTVTSGNVGEAVVDSAQLTFTPANWSVPKTVTVRGVDDQNADGSQLTLVTVAVDPSSNAAFVGLGSQTVTVTTTDNEVADFAISQTGGSTSVTEAGSSDSFTVVLLSRPGSSVTITASSPDLGEVTVSPSSVTFPPGQWNSPKTFTVTGVDDAVADGDIVTLVVVAVDDASSDDVFDGAADKTVAVTTRDNEVPGFTVTESGGGTSVSESGSTDSFTIVLGAQPVSPVAFTITSADPGEVTVVTSTVSFGPSDWSTPKAVSVQGVPDGVTDGPQLTDVTIAVSPTSDPVWVGLAAKTVTVNTSDID